MIQLELSEQGGCPPELIWSSTFVGPLFHLNVAIIENVSNEPVSVGRFVIKENRSDRLHTRQEIRTAFDSQSAQKQYLFSPGILKPGESLVVPIELSLKMDEVLDLDLSDEGAKVIVPADYANVLKRVRARGGLNYTARKAVPTIVSAEALERIMNRGKPTISWPNEYLYGPSVSIESLEINKFGYLVRRFDPSKLLITSGTDEEVMEGGSCPYVYTYSASRKSWSKEGVILYGRNSKLKESADEIVLHRFSGKVLVQENDPEDSFIDSIHIRALGADGSETILYPQNKTLLSVDGDYVELRQGEHLMLDFHVPHSLVAQKYVLVTSGYYLSYDSRLTDWIRRRTRLRKQGVRALRTLHRA